MKKMMVFVAFVFLLSDVSVALAFRCGGQLVSIGTSKTKVLLICGEPIHKEKGTENSSKKSNKKKSSTKKNTGKQETGKVERLYYNCGVNDFIYVLTFRDGKLESEQTEGYGTGAGNCDGN